MESPFDRGKCVYCVVINGFRGEKRGGSSKSSFTGSLL